MAILADVARRLPVVEWVKYLGNPYASRSVYIGGD